MYKKMSKIETALLKTQNQDCKIKKKEKKEIAFLCLNKKTKLNYIILNPSVFLLCIRYKT